MECGSSHHFYQTCKEYRDKYSRLTRTEHFRTIQQWFGAILKPKQRPGLQNYSDNNQNNHMFPNYYVPTLSYAQIARSFKPLDTISRDFTNQTLSQSIKGKN